jgi:phosphatidate cytidylyltransferase
MNPTFIIIAAITIGILAFASTLTLILKKWKPENETYKKVWIIIKTWWVIAAFLLLTVGLAPWGLIVGFAFLSILAAQEYYKHSRLVESKKLLSIILTVFVILQYGALAFEKFRLFQSLPILMVIVCLPPLAIFTDGLKRMPDLVASLVGPIVAFHCLACLPALFLVVNRSSWGGDSSALLAVFILILLTEGNDVIQFLCGKSWGKRKITPEISPNKTEAGFIGGLILTTMLGVLLFSRGLGFSLLEGAVLGFLISLYGIQGDLYFSALKRYFGTKDFSNALPGHGGYLDRLDSLVLTAPVVFYAIWFLKGGT